MNTQSAPPSIRFAALMPHAPVLVPGVGGDRGNEAQSTVDAMRRVAQRAVATGASALVLISPHSPRQRKAFGVWESRRLKGTLASFGAPAAGFDLPADATLLESLKDQAARQGVATWAIDRGAMDHGVTVPLWFLAEAGWTQPIVVLSLNYPGEGGLIAMGQAIAAAGQELGRELVLIASGDMSHRLKPGAPAGFHPQAVDFDQTFIELLRRGAYAEMNRLDPELQDLAAEDAVDSTLVALSAVNWKTTGHAVLSYQGPFGVGYGVAILFEATQAEGIPTAAASSAGAALPKIARQSVEAAFRREGTNAPGPGADYLAKRHGVFVTIRDLQGELRGCVGTLAPRCRDLVEETWKVAQDAAFGDTRFDRVQRDELARLRFEVSVLHSREDIGSEADLDPARYGVIVSSPDGRRGVLLPAIAGIDTVAQQLATVRRKAGIDPDEPIRLERFQVDHFEE